MAKYCVNIILQNNNKKFTEKEHTEINKYIKSISELIRKEAYILNTVVMSYNHGLAENGSKLKSKLTIDDGDDILPIPEDNGYTSKQQQRESSLEKEDVPIKTKRIPLTKEEQDAPAFYNLAERMTKQKIEEEIAYAEKEFEEINKE